MLNLYFLQRQNEHVKGLFFFMIHVLKIINPKSTKSLLFFLFLYLASSLEKLSCSTVHILCL